MTGIVDEFDIASVAPALQPLARVATALGDWRHHIVFIGGAVAPILQTHPPFTRVRPTDDVDAISAAVSYAAQHEMDSALANLGFRRNLLLGGHANRWIAPGGVPFDLVPVAGFLGASGNKWDQLAIQHAATDDLAGHLTIRHVSAPYFLVQKWTAYCDRGVPNPYTSIDLEDFLALLASRPSLSREIAAISHDVREYLRRAARTLLDHPDSGELIEAHLNNCDPRESVVAAVSAMLRVLAE